MLATREGPEELAIQIDSIGEYDNRRIVQPLNQFARVENHGKALPAALGVPDHSRAAVALYRRCLQCAFHRLVDGVELVVARHLLGHLSTVILKHNKIAE